jgi:hypothetical protein
MIANRTSEQSDGKNLMENTIQGKAVKSTKPLDSGSK